jgi:hypothetical protein
MNLKLHRKIKPRNNANCFPITRSGSLPTPQPLDLKPIRNLRKPPVIPEIKIHPRSPHRPAAPIISLQPPKHLADPQHHVAPDVPIRHLHPIEAKAQVRVARHRDRAPHRPRDDAHHAVRAAGRLLAMHDPALVVQQAGPHARPRVQRHEPRPGQVRRVGPRPRRGGAERDADLDLAQVEAAGEQRGGPQADAEDQVGREGHVGVQEGGGRGHVGRVGGVDAVVVLEGLFFGADYGAWFDVASGGWDCGGGGGGVDGGCCCYWWESYKMCGNCSSS